MQKSTQENRGKSDDTFNKFKKRDPPKFDGGTYPLVVVEWIKALEAIFDHLEFSDRDRVECAVFSLVKAARTWWEATKATVDVNVEEICRFVQQQIFYSCHTELQVERVLGSSPRHLYC